MWLDIACGIRNNNRLVPNALHCDLERGAYTQVVCDIQNLPFKNKAFTESYSFHTLEHIPNPIRALKELIRVTTTFLEIEVPHRYCNRARSGSHISMFTCNWFKKILRQYRFHVWSYYTGWLALPIVGRLIIKVHIYLEERRGDKL